jgi:hypothetical protein
MNGDRMRHAILDLATEDYTALWVLERSIRPAAGAEALRGIVRDMLRDGALAMFRGDHFIGEETAITSADEVEALFADAATWRPSLEPPRIMVVATEAGKREYYGRS